MPPTLAPASRKAGSLSAILAVATIALAQPAGGAPADASTDMRFQDWRKSCPDTHRARRCIVYTQSGGQTRIGVVAVRVSVGLRDGSNVVVVDMSAPVVQERRFGINVDQERPMVATIGECDQISCRSILTGPAADALVAQFRAGREATVVYFAEERVPVRARVSLQGFTAAYNSLSKPRG